MRGEPEVLEALGSEQMAQAALALGAAAPPLKCVLYFLKDPHAHTSVFLSREIDDIGGEEEIKRIGPRSSYGYVALGTRFRISGYATYAIFLSEHHNQQFSK